MQSSSKLKVILISLLTAYCLLLTDLYADIHVSTSCSYTDVNNALSLASDGDTVSVPAGTATWNSTLIINKEIILKGAGASLTRINNNSFFNQSLIKISPSSNKAVRVTGFYFDLVDNTTRYNSTIVIQGSTNGSYGLTKIRIDHNTLNRGSNQLYWIGWAYGVVDHNYFLNGHVSVMFVGDYDYAWNRPIEAGTANAVYIETNTFIADSNYGQGKNDQFVYHQSGARSVTRYNIFDTRDFNNGPNNSCYSFIDSHGNWGPNSNLIQYRGQPIIEMYGNQFHAYNSFNFFDFRGGSLLIYDNTCTMIRPGIPEIIDLWEEECWTGGGPFSAPLPKATSWPAEDQVNNSFFWNNTFNGSPAPITFATSVESATFMHEGRDYWLHAPAATGGRTVYTNRTNNEVFVSTMPNAYYPYTPYTYPHPLTLEPDPTPPTTPASVRDGVSGTSDLSFTYSTTSLSANWDASSDTDTGISKYYYAISTAVISGQWIVNWTDNGTATSMTRTSLNLTVNSTYYFMVKALNGYGLYSSTATSDGQVVLPLPLNDTTPPSTPATVRDGTGEDINSTLSSTELSANWDSSSDADSGISKYWYSIGTTPGGTDVVSWTDNGPLTAVTKTGLSLSVLGNCYFSVKAQDGFGLYSGVTTSDGQIVLDQPDTTPPSNVPQVDDGLALDASYTHSTTALSGNWIISSDGESGIAKYYYAIGTSPSSTNIVSWTDNGKNTVATKTGLSLTVGVTYYFIVKAENGVGMQSGLTSSNGQYVVVIDTSDTTPPTSVMVVRDGTGDVDISSTTSKTQLSARWNESHDDESGVEKYYYAIGTATGGSDIAGWKDVGLALSVTKTGLSLTVGTTYYFSVKAENGVGLKSPVTSSDGQFVASTGTAATPPVIPPQQSPVESKAYPNPCNFKDGAIMTFTVGTENTATLPSNAGLVKIFTISGKLVKKLTITEGTSKADWDGTNEDGEKVQRGIYIYQIIKGNGDRATGKLAVIK